MSERDIIERPSQQKVWLNTPIFPEVSPDGEGAG